MTVYFFKLKHARIHTRTYTHTHTHARTPHPGRDNSSGRSPHEYATVLVEECRHGTVFLWFVLHLGGLALANSVPPSDPSLPIKEKIHNNKQEVKGWLMDGNQ